MSYSVMSPFFALPELFSTLLAMVLLSLAEVFFQLVLELMARRMCETSVVAVASTAPSFCLCRRPWFYLCIITTIIIMAAIL